MIWTEDNQGPFPASSLPTLWPKQKPFMTWPHSPAQTHLSRLITFPSAFTPAILGQWVSEHTLLSCISMTLPTSPDW